ncbi:MAG: DUF559 domain-containing protein [Flammeovirgaceae bacterium]
MTNQDTLYKQWDELMGMLHCDASGQLPAKTIVFAITQKHALRLEEAFNEMYPEHRGQLARVITSGVERAKDLLTKFKKEDLPRIAISVDMLDTGVDVPEIMNLAFMKPVGSQIKFWQMIGRGTRPLEACTHSDWLPDKKKDNFLIVDFWENFAHFNMMPKEEGGARQIPVLVTIFNTRLSKLELLMSSPPAPLHPGEGRSATVVDVHVPAQLLANARELRKNQTSTEDLLWGLLRNRQLNGFKFRRQHPIADAFILDFFCAETRVAIEVDGEGHAQEEQKQYDANRSAVLKEYGITVLRFTNEEVKDNTEAVLQHILLSCNSMIQPPPSPTWRGVGGEEDIKRIINLLRSDIARIPMDSFTVKKNLKDIREVWMDDFWQYLTPQKIELLRMKVAPLLRFVPDVNLDEAFFTSKMERVGLALLQKKDAAALIASIREDVSLLPSNIAQVQEKMLIKEAVLANKFWEEASLKKIEDARVALAPLMKYKREKPSMVIELGLDDVIDSRQWVVVRKEGQKIMVEEYRKKVEEKIEQLAAQHPTIKRLQQGEAVKMEDLLQLEQTLETELNTDELNLNEDNMLKAFGVRVGSLTAFLKHVLNQEALPSYEQIVRKAFDVFILEHNYNADQTRFLRTVQNVFLQKRKLDEADLYEAPFTNFGSNAVEKYFTQVEIEELIKLTKKLAA